MQPSIYDTIGAAAPGDAAVDISYDKAWSDPDLGGYFSNVDRGKLKGHPRTSSRPRSAAPMLTRWCSTSPRHWQSWEYPSIRSHK